MRRAVATLAAVLLALSAAPAFALPGVEAGVRGTYWFPQLAGTVQSTAAGLEGTELDVENDLGIEKKGFPTGEAFVRLGGLHLRVGYARLKFDGDKVVTKNINFNGLTFPASTRVLSHLETKMYDGEIQYDLIRPDVVAVAVNFGLILKVKYVDGTVDLDAASVGKVAKDFRAPLPMIGAAAGVGILKDFVRVDARATGIAYGGNHLYDADGYVSLCPFPFLRIQGGYRYLDLKVDDKPDILAAVKLNGPYAGLQLSF